MGSDNPFGIRIEALRKSHKQETAPPEVVDEIGDRHGFSDRGGLRRGGRRAPEPARFMPRYCRRYPAESQPKRDGAASSKG